MSRSSAIHKTDIVKTINELQPNEYSINYGIGSVHRMTNDLTFKPEWDKNSNVRPTTSRSQKSPTSNGMNNSTDKISFYNANPNQNLQMGYNPQVNAMLRPKVITDMQGKVVDYRDVVSSKKRK